MEQAGETGLCAGRRRGTGRALLEADVFPDLLVGTSAGALNAVYLAVHGFTPQGVAGLEDAWRDAAAADLMLPHQPEMASGLVLIALMPALREGK